MRENSTKRKSLMESLKHLSVKTLEDHNLTITFRAYK